MKLTYYVKRILNDKLKLFFIALIFLIPVLDLIFQLRYIPVGAVPGRADFNTFLTGSNSFIFQTLLLDFLPVFLLIVACDDCFEDYTTGHRNVLITKWGKKNYVLTNVGKGFIISFCLMLLTLLLNLLMAHLLYSGAVYSGFDDLILDFKPTDLFYISVQHSLITNLCFILTTSFLSGVVGAAGAALAVAVHNRKIVYPVLFLIWFALKSTDKSLSLAMQPFSEYGFDTIVPVYIAGVLLFSVVTVAAAVKEIKYAKI